MNTSSGSRGQARWMTNGTTNDDQWTERQTATWTTDEQNDERWMNTAISSYQLHPQPPPFSCSGHVTTTAYRRHHHLHLHHHLLILASSPQPQPPPRTGHIITTSSNYHHLHHLFVPASSPQTQLLLVPAASPPPRISLVLAASNHEQEGPASTSVGEARPVRTGVNRLSTSILFFFFLFLTKL